VLGVLRTLVGRQVWRMNAKLWVGFLRCLRLLEPQAFAVALQLPPAQLRDALTRFPDMAPGLRQFAAAADVRVTVPAATLAVIAGDPQPQPPPPGAPAAAAADAAAADAVARPPSPPAGGEAS